MKPRTLKGHFVLPKSRDHRAPDAGLKQDVGRPNIAPISPYPQRNRTPDGRATGYRTPQKMDFVGSRTLQRMDFVGSRTPQKMDFMGYRTLQKINLEGFRTSQKIGSFYTSDRNLVLWCSL